MAKSKFFQASLDRRMSEDLHLIGHKMCIFSVTFGRWSAINDKETSVDTQMSSSTGHVGRLMNRIVDPGEIVDAPSREAGFRDRLTGRRLTERRYAESRISSKLTEHPFAFLSGVPSDMFLPRLGG